MLKKGLFFGIAILFLAAIIYAQKEVTAQEGKVVYIRGSVLVMKTGTTIWLDAEKGQALNDQDKIKTLENSYAEIALDKALKNIVKLEQFSEITIVKIKPAEIELPRGRVLSLLQKLERGSKFEVKTPTAVAGVSGSGMSVETDGATAIVGVFENKAFVQGIDEQGNRMSPVDIDEGFKRIVERFGMPGELIALTDFERQQWSEWRQEIREHTGTTEGKGPQETAPTEEIGNLQEKQQETQEGSREGSFESREFQKKEATEATTPGGGTY